MANLFTSSFLMCAATIFLFLILMMSTPSSTVHGSGDHQLDLGWVTTRSPCTGSIADCLAVEEEGEEFQLDSEISRRILQSRRYISYGALGRNNVPCSRRGASYYNCRPGAQANPYTRGCSAITRCRG